MIRLFFVLIFIFCLELQAELQTRTKVLMGTFATITLPEASKGLFTSSFELLDRVDNSLSSYKKNSPIYKLNHQKKSDINCYTYEALLLSKKYYRESGGYFNVAIGSVTKELYHFGENERLPESWELNASDVSLDALSFDTKSVRLGQGVTIDLGGFGKGYGVDRVAEHLKVNNIVNARIALSGDIRCIGKCKINIYNPFADEPLAKFATLKDEMGISTSGNYNRYVGEPKNNHLINPNTKKSQNNFISLTLISTLPNSDIDAYATAASVMPKELAYKFLESLDVGYIVLQENKELIISKNINDYITFEK